MVNSFYDHGFKYSSSFQRKQYLFSIKHITILQIPLGFHGKQRVHGVLTTPAEGHQHEWTMHIPNRAGTALADQ
jgi:hypothetical protein